MRRVALKFRFTPARGQEDAGFQADVPGHPGFFYDLQEVASGRFWVWLTEPMAGTLLTPIVDDDSKRMALKRVREDAKARFRFEVEITGTRRPQ